MNITSSSLSFLMRKFSAALFFFALFVGTLQAQKFQKTVSPMNALNTFSTSNQFIDANVDASSGFVTVLLPPGRFGLDPSLSFAQKSFFTCSIGSTFFTNNEVISNPPANTKQLNDGITVKIKDTIRTIWANKNNVDIIQDIYPVAFTKSGQIVYKWSFTNHGNASINIACQYLQDIQITDPAAHAPNSTDGPQILTKWSYQPLWQTWPNANLNQALPWFYIGFLYTLPNTPSLDPGLAGMGYMDYGAPLNLIKPFRMSIGDWYTMASTIFGQGPWPWGSSYGYPPQTDNAVLVEFPAQGVGTGKTATIGKTSYGTGEFEKCVGSLFSVDFYPEHVVWDSSYKVYSPNPIHIEKFVVNPDKLNASANTKITLAVGDDMNLTDSTGIPNWGKSQTQPSTGAGLFIAPNNVGYFNWWVGVNPALYCTGPDIDTLIFTATCGVCPPGFLNSQGAQECDQLITIDCAEADVDAPEFVDTLNVLKSSSIAVRDWRTTDKGLQSITWIPTKGTDTTKIMVQPPSPPIQPCYNDKVNHIVKIIQIDSTIGGCYDFTFTDCLGHQSFHTVCMQAKSVVHPDSLPPVFTLIKRLLSRDTSFCSSQIDSFEVSDSRLHDVGICKLEVIPGTAVNMEINKIPFTNGDGVTRFTVIVMDSVHDGSICIRATDCATPAHFTDTCIHFCRSIPSEVQDRNRIALALEANHPNPFLHITTFNYTIAEYGMVRLYLYDELGREMARIIDGAKAQGTYTVDFDGSKLPSGSYIVRLENGGGVVSRRVVVER